MAEVPPSLLWTIIPSLGALSLSLGIIAPLLGTYAVAYIAAPREITTFIDAVDSYGQENETYDSDVAKVPRLEDKLRLGRILREIQKQGDDLRDDINQLVATEDRPILRTSARVLWASHRRHLEDRVRRLDILRMRFLIVFMGIVAATAGERSKDAARSAPRNAEHMIPPAPPVPPAPPAPPAPPVPRPNINKEYSGNHQRPARRLTTQTMGHSEKTAQTHQSGWFGVVDELQRSPLMRKRHASIEATMRTPRPVSPDDSPLLGLVPVQVAPIPEAIKL